MSTIRLEPVTLSQWDDYIDQNPHSLLFHTSNWLEMLSRIYNLEWLRLGLWEQSNLVGLFPLLKRKLGPFRLVGSPLMITIASTPYIGPLIDIYYLPSALESLINYSHSMKFDHIEISFPTLLQNLQAIKKLGFSTELCQSMIVELNSQSIDQIWFNLTSACRRAVRKAEKSGLTILNVSDTGFLDEYYSMCKHVYRGSRRNPHLSKEFYALAWEFLAQGGSIKVMLAVHENQIVAGGVFLLFRKTAAYYLSGASYKHAHHLRPNNLIQWTFIEWAASNGYQIYDMGGATVSSITHFKQSFGAQFTPYTRIYRANSSIASLGRTAYSLLIPIWRRLSNT
jgi:hypothetical protein